MNRLVLPVLVLTFLISSVSLAVATDPSTSSTTPAVEQSTTADSGTTPTASGSDDVDVEEPDNAISSVTTDPAADGTSPSVSATTQPTTVETVETASIDPVITASPVVISSPEAPTETEPTVESPSEETVPMVRVSTYDVSTDAEKDHLFLGCLNPVSNKTGRDRLRWVIESNVPFRQRVSWTPLTTSWTCNERRIEDSILADRLRVRIGPDSDHLVRLDMNPWTSHLQEPDSDCRTELLIEVGVAIDWCDSAGAYSGHITLDVLQE